jgi:outer membrane protein
MKKLINTLTLASIASLHIASIDVAQADIAGFEVGAYNWTPDYKGTMSASSDGSEGTTIDMQDDLGFSDDSHNIIWFSLEHPVPVIPNIKIVSSDLSSSATGNKEEEFVFNGQTYNANVDNATTFDMSNIEYTLYYEILDNWINVDLGMTFRQYDGMVEISAEGDSAREDLDFTIPLLYVAARADLPFTGFFVEGQINTISAGGNSLTDTSFGLGYESDIGFGAKAGYRTFEMDVDEDGFQADLEFSGAYLSVFYHF